MPAISVGLATAVGGEVGSSGYRRVNEEFHDLLVTLDWQGFGEEVGQVVGAGHPGHSELTLTDTVTNSVEAHIHALAALDLDGVVS